MVPGLPLYAAVPSMSSPAQCLPLAPAAQILQTLPGINTLSLEGMAALMFAWAVVTFPTTPEHHGGKPLSRHSEMPRNMPPRHSLLSSVLILQSTDASRNQQRGPEGAELLIHHLPWDFGAQDPLQMFVPYGKTGSAKGFVDNQTIRASV